MKCLCGCPWAVSNASPYTPKPLQQLLLHTLTADCFIISHFLLQFTVQRPQAPSNAQSCLNSLCSKSTHASPAARSRACIKPAQPELPPLLPTQLYNTLKRFADAEVGLLDAWSIAISAPSAGLFHELPHSLQLSQEDRDGPTQVWLSLAQSSPPGRLQVLGAWEAISHWQHAAELGLAVRVPHYTVQGHAGGAPWAMLLLPRENRQFLQLPSPCMPP
jgi:hypothetical protein